jgi:glycosyltransferase involved in cell wall biosynthesis
LERREKPRLLMLTSSFPTGPSDETCGYIRDFARSLSDEFTVEVLAPADRRADGWPQDSFTLRRSVSLVPRRLDPFQASADFNGLLSESVTIRLGFALSFACYFKQAFGLARHADVICSHWLVPCGLVGAMVARRLGKPHVVVEHSGALHLLSRTTAGRALVRFIVGSSHRTFAVSDDLKSKLVALSPLAESKIEVMPMGVADRITKEYPGGASASGAALFIGRLTEVKGLDVLLRAMQGMDNARLVVAGDGPQRSRLEALARSLPVRAEFLGQVTASERARLLAACDAVVIPSLVLPCGRTEGMPVVCLEAMTAGRAVIASRVGGLAEMISDGEDGMLFEAGNSRMLREKLKQAFSDSELRLKLSLNARRKAARFAWPQVASRYGEIIRDSLR